MYLHALGWNSFFQDHWNSRPGDSLAPARVVEEQRGAYRIVGEQGELAAEITGRLRHAAQERSAFPAVGDWVAADIIGDQSKASIHEVLPRRTKLSRKVTGDRSAEQILVANVDTVIVVTSLNDDLNPRRLERYFTMIWESGAQPVLVLSKSDVCAEPAAMIEEIASVAVGVETHVLSAVTGEGLDALTPYIGAGRTVVLIGSSGVGKSTLINRLLHAEVQFTTPVREDGRGRHATTSRRLFPMPAGGVLIDTPGIRELQLWDAENLQATFEEIFEIAMNCRFRDCRHASEPGCAVREAIASGSLDATRIENLNKLRREADHLDTRRDLAAQAEQRKIRRQRAKAMRQRPRGKP